MVRRVSEFGSALRQGSVDGGFEGLAGGERALGQAGRGLPAPSDEGQGVGGLVVAGTDRGAPPLLAPPAG